VVVETSLGNIGGLICGEHYHPLLRHALAIKGEQVHIGVWPKGAHLDQATDLLSRSHALESQVYVLVSCGLLSPEDVPDDFPLKGRTLWNVNGGSGIIGPDGKYLAGPVYNEETILYAEIDTRCISSEKSGRSTPLVTIAATTLCSWLYGKGRKTPEPANRRY